MDYSLLLSIAIILFVTKLLSLLMKKLGLPHVVGALLGGLLVGPAILNWVKPNTILNFMAEIGVIMIMFSAGMETNLKSIKQNALASFVVTILGVIVPLGLGFVVACLFNGGFSNMTIDKVIHNVFYGVILTATSVSITVATLKELGKLNSRVGTTVLSAAILDDIIGIFILTFVLSLKDGSSSPLKVGISTLLFFVFAGVAGVLMRTFFKFLTKKYPHTQRIPIFGLVLCLLFAYIAEEFFHISDVTGAFFAGIILSNLSDTDYIEKKIDINSYMIFSPLFFANIGIGISFSGFQLSMLWFGIALIVISIISKLVGCYFGARICRYSKRDSYRIGIGMIARAEVALIVAQKGVAIGIIESSALPIIVLIVIITSFATPIFLKLSYRKELHIPMMPPKSTPLENVSEYDDFIIPADNTSASAESSEEEKE